MPKCQESGDPLRENVGNMNKTKLAVAVVVCSLSLNGLVFAQGSFSNIFTMGGDFGFASVWGWNPEGNAEINNLPILGGSWMINLRVAVSPTDGGVTGVWSAQHTFALHPAEGEIGPGNVAGQSFSFGANDFGRVTEQYQSAAHPAHHSDDYTFTFDRSAFAGSTRIAISGGHAPEPSSLAIFGLGASGLVAGRWLRRKS